MTVPPDPTPPPTRGGAPATSKGARTRQRILEEALSLFRKRGFEGTTMREVARAADVSLGNAYYYFPSKEHLVQAFYAEVNEAHRERCDRVLHAEKDLEKRLVGVLRAQIDAFEPYHEFARALFRTAADPSSPINPFSEESRPVRERSIAVMGRVVAGANVRVPKDLTAHLPELLWVYLAGITLYWVHDASPGRERTYRLIENSARLVVKLIRLSGLPLMGGIRRSAIAMLRDALGRR